MRHRLRTTFHRRDAPAMKTPRSPLALALLALLAPAAHAGVVVDDFGGSEISFEGLLQTDGAWYDSDGFDLDADPNDGTDTDFELRRAELVLKGKGPGNFDWVLGYDAANDGKWLDANIAYRIGGDKRHFVRVGQFKQFNSMEELSSTKNNDFISKAIITGLYAVGRRQGVAYGYGTDQWNISGGWYGRELTEGRGRGSGYGIRGNWAPMTGDGDIFNVGLSYVTNDTYQDTIRVRSRPAAELSNRLVDTNIRNADSTSTLGLESFWVRGPFKLQAEYMVNTIDRYETGFADQPGGDYTTQGGYLSGMWNITGETWSYKDGTPGTAKPANANVGMWQLGLRYDTLDLNDGDTRPGTLDTWTVGVNYYWRSNFKFAVDYVKADAERNGIDESPSLIAARAQFYW